MSEARMLHKNTAKCLRSSFLGIFLLSFCSSGLAADHADHADQAVILQYHHISTATPASTSLSPDAFREHMYFLKDSGFTVAPLEQVIARLKSGDVLADRTAVITFDDAYLSVYEEAFPLLKTLDFPYTIFISSGLVSSNSSLYASWEQLREMAESGATLANHTVSHPYLLEQADDKDENDWLNWVSTEIEDAEQKILDETGQNHKLLAYPYGEYNPAIRQLVTDLGYVAFGQHSGPINANSDFAALPRFPFSGIYASMNTLPAKVNSLAFNFLSSQQSTVTVETAPTVELIFEEDYPLQTLNCFHNNDAMTISKPNAQEQRVIIEPSKANSSRRFRYNCTMPDYRGNSGRYYWLSIPWVNLQVAE